VAGSLLMRYVIVICGVVVAISALIRNFRIGPADYRWLVAAVVASLFAASPFLLPRSEVPAPRGLLADRARLWIKGGAALIFCSMALTFATSIAEVLLTPLSRRPVELACGTAIVAGIVAMNIGIQRLSRLEETVRQGRDPGRSRKPPSPTAPR